MAAVGRGASCAVVVAAWSSEAKRDLEECLAGLAGQTLPPQQVVVVIDHNPELAAWARAALDGADVLENSGERGIVGARNTGIAAVDAEIVAFTDDDAVPDPGWLEAMVAALEDPEALGVGGELVPRWLGPEPRWFPGELYWVFGCSYTGLPTELAPIRNPIGANMAIRREVLEAVGGFALGAPPRQLRIAGKVLSAGHSLDDTSLGIRVGRAFPDKYWLYQPAARVHHKVAPGRAGFSYMLRRCFEEGEGKAALARSHGAEAGLESERRHLLVTIPKGIGRGFLDLLRGDPAGPARALSLAVGTAATAVGYLVGAVRARPGPEPSSEPA